MSNNAAVTSEGLEMGRAQFMQAQAARTNATVRMNPVLLKPSADTFSQVIVNGVYDPAITQMPWMERYPLLWPIVEKALQSLLSEYEQVIIEGAGSPAEINLRARDIVNMSVALACNADVYLVADIDRGGAFAHLLGTFACLTPEEQQLIKGFVLNKFRGDVALLGNAMDWLQERTGVPTVAIIPMIRHRLPEEDAFHHRAEPNPETINIALLLYPYASNLDDIDPLIAEPGVTVTPIGEFRSLAGFHAIILPGSKNTVASLNYLRASGLAAEVVRAGERGTAILGICGGMQMLGRQILDPHALEGGDMPGLGMLDLITRLEAQKTTIQRSVRWLEGGEVSGYEIHHGITEAGPAVTPHLAEGIGWRQGNSVGVYLHGLLGNTAYRQRYLQALGWQGESVDWSAQIENELDRIVYLIDESGWSSHFSQ